MAIPDDTPLQLLDLGSGSSRCTTPHRHRRQTTHQPVNQPAWPVHLGLAAVRHHRRTHRLRPTRDALVTTDDSPLGMADRIRECGTRAWADCRPIVPPTVPREIIWNLIGVPANVSPSPELQNGKTAASQDSSFTRQQVHLCRQFTTRIRQVTRSQSWLQFHAGPRLPAPMSHRSFRGERGRLPYPTSRHRRPRST